MHLLLTLGFKAEDIVKQLNESLASLNVSCVDIFYLHWPDHDIPIAETLKGVDQLHKGIYRFSLLAYISSNITNSSQTFLEETLKGVHQLYKGTLCFVGKSSHV